jgi:hypothetical protein
MKFPARLFPDCRQFHFIADVEASLDQYLLTPHSLGNVILFFRYSNKELSSLFENAIEICGLTRGHFATLKSGMCLAPCSANRARRRARARSRSLTVTGMNRPIWGQRVTWFCFCRAKRPPSEAPTSGRQQTLEDGTD